MLEIFIIHIGQNPHVKPMDTFWHGCSIVAFNKRSLAEEYGSSIYTEDTSVIIRMYDETELYRLMIDTYEYGAVGICVFADVELSKLDSSYMFANRLTEIGYHSPTLLAKEYSDQKPEVLCYSRFGAKVIKINKVTTWCNYSYIDQLNQVFCPFSDMVKKESFQVFEINPKPALLIYDDKILGPWGGLAGNYTFFTKKELVDSFYKDINSYKYAIMSLSSSKCLGRTVDSDILEIINFKQRLKDLSETELYMQCHWVLNPNGHRSEMGFGTFCSSNRFILTALSGNYIIEDMNSLKATELDYDAYYSSLLFKGPGMNYTFNEFHISLHQSLSQYDHEDNLTDSEINDIIDQELEDLSNFDMDEVWDIQESYEDIFNCYIVKVWDTITGHVGEPLVFQNYFDMLSWCLKFELFDRQLRIHGAQGCHGTIGIPKSKNPKQEEQKGKIYQEHILSLMRQALKKSYNLNMANSLVSIFNQTIGTQRIDIAGYGHDLISAYEISDYELSELLNVDIEDILNVRKEDIHKYHPEGLKIALHHIEGTTWGKLSEKSKKSICSALYSYQVAKNSVNTDFSSTIVQLAKPLEVELNEILRRVIEHISITPSCETDTALTPYHQRKDKRVKRFISNPEKGLSLGELKESLKTSLKSSLMIKEFHSTLIDMGYDYLLSEEFNNDINQLIDARNGSAHESIKSIDQAEAFIRMQLGASRQNDDGILTKLMSRLPS